MKRNHTYSLLTSGSYLSDYSNDIDRYILLESRIKEIIKSPLGKNISSLYFADYKHSIRNESKLNSNVPFYCKSTLKEIFALSFSIQFKIRKYFNNFSFSDFLFRDLNKKCIIHFEKTKNTNILKIIDHEYIKELFIKIPIKENILTTSFNFRLQNSDQSDISNIKFFQELNIEKDIIEINFDNLNVNKNFKTQFIHTIKEKFNTTISDDVFKAIYFTMYYSLIFNDIKAYTYIPSIPIKEKNRDLSTGGLIIPQFVNEGSISNAVKQHLFFIIQKWFSESAIADFTEDAINEIKLKATGAAISQVMARNMSHNIGSHVLSKLITEDTVNQIFFQDKKTNQNNIAKQNNNQEYEAWNFYQCINKIKELDYKSDPKIIDTKVTNVKLIADFFNYLKIRMDYLADITTSTPVIENTKGMYNDIIKPFIQNRVLNDRISGISEFNYEIIFCKPPLNHEDHCKSHSTENCKNSHKRYIIDSENNKDIPVSIPNDVVGCHAFYTILENIIRNTAKHAVKPKEGNVEFKIKIQEAKDVFQQYANVLQGDNLNKYYAVSIFDNCELTGNSVIENWGKEKKNRANIGEDVKEIFSIQKLVIEQNDYLNKSILKDNQLRHGAWGLIEMDASAAYLRKINVQHIDADEYKIKCLKGEKPVTFGNKLCIFQAYAEQDKYLGYRFFIHKPQEVLIIEGNDTISNSLKTDGKTIEDLQNDGIWIKTTAEIKKVIESNVALPHRLVVVDYSALDIFCKIQFNPLFSKRIVKVAKDFKRQSNKDIMWKEFYNDKSDYRKAQNNITAHHDNHGMNYCEYLHIKCAKFIEINFSATNHFFKGDTFNYSWPIKLGIIDERIQALRSEKYSIQEQDCQIKKIDNSKCFHENGGVPYATIYKYTNILLPTIEKEGDLNKQTFDNELDEILKFIRKCSRDIEADSEDGNGLDDFPCEFIVIHLGVIEKLIAAWNRRAITNGTKIYDKEKPDEISKFIKIIVLEVNKITEDDKRKKAYDSIILTSGRGKPHNLPKDIRYLNFSTVSQYLTTQRNKFALTEALYSARNQF